MTGETGARRLAGIDCWIFDLDNTLYSFETDLFAQIDVRMSEFIQAALGVDRAAAKRLQKSYFRAYGTTLRGLMVNHGTDPAAFLDYVHDIDHSVLARRRRNSRPAALAALSGRKLVFTNGSVRHAARVLDRLGIAGHFESGVRHCGGRTTCRSPSTTDTSGCSRRTGCARTAPRSSRIPSPICAPPRREE